LAYNGRGAPHILHLGNDRIEFCDLATEWRQPHVDGLHAYIHPYLLAHVDLSAHPEIRENALRRPAWIEVRYDGFLTRVWIRILSYQFNETIDGRRMLRLYVEATHPVEPDDEILSRIGSRSGPPQTQGEGRRDLALLVRHLDPEQQRTFERNGYFEVKGSNSGRRYRIHAGMGASINIEQFDPDGLVRATLCAAPFGYGLPEYDMLLAQKLALETDEMKFLQTANIFDGSGVFPRSWF